jgi:hypothetical protein
MVMPSHLVSQVRRLLVVSDVLQRKVHVHREDHPSPLRSAPSPRQTIADTPHRSFEFTPK